MKAVKIELKENEYEIIVGYEDEFHTRINKISFTVEAYFKNTQKSRGLQYDSLEEAINAAQAIYNYRKSEL